MNSNLQVGPSFNGIVSLKKIGSRAQNTSIRYNYKNPFRKIETDSNNDFYLTGVFSEITKNSKNAGVTLRKEAKDWLYDALSLMLDTPIKMPKGEVVVSKIDAGKKLGFSVKTKNPQKGDLDIFFKSEDYELNI